MCFFKPPSFLKTLLQSAQYGVLFKLVVIDVIHASEPTHHWLGSEADHCLEPKLIGPGYIGPGHYETGEVFGYFEPGGMCGYFETADLSSQWEAAI